MNILSLLLWFFASLAIHEAGHAAAAQALGLPWRVTVRHGIGIRIGSEDRELQSWQLVLTAAAGPFANLLLAAVAYGLSQPLGVLCGLEFAICNLLPLPHSDGSRLMRPKRTLAKARMAA